DGERAEIGPGSHAERACECANVGSTHVCDVLILGVLLAALIGLSLGLLGGGGSILTVPIFVYVLSFGAKEAIAMSLAGVGAPSLFDAVSHWRAGNVNVRVALSFGI